MVENRYFINTVFCPYKIRVDYPVFLRVVYHRFFTVYNCFIQRFFPRLFHVSFEMSDSVVDVKLYGVRTRLRVQESVSQLIINYYYL